MRGLWGAGGRAGDARRRQANSPGSMPSCTSPHPPWAAGRPWQQRLLWPWPARIQRRWPGRPRPRPLPQTRHLRPAGGGGGANRQLEAWGACSCRAAAPMNCSASVHRRPESCQSTPQALPHCVPMLSHLPWAAAEAQALAAALVREPSPLLATAWARLEAEALLPVAAAAASAAAAAKLEPAWCGVVRDGVSGRLWAGIQGRWPTRAENRGRVHLTSSCEQVLARQEAAGGRGGDATGAAPHRAPRPRPRHWRLQRTGGGSWRLRREDCQPNAAVGRGRSNLRRAPAATQQLRGPGPALPPTGGGRQHQQAHKQAHEAGGTHFEGV